MKGKNPAKELIDGYNNVIRHLEFIQTLMTSLISLKEKIDESLEKGDDHATSLIIAMRIQIDAAITSGLISHPELIDKRMEIFESMIDPEAYGFGHREFDPSMN